MEGAVEVPAYGHAHWELPVAGRAQHPAEPRVSAIGHRDIPGPDLVFDPSVAIHDEGAGDAGAVSLQGADGLGGLMELSASLDRPLDPECVQITPADHLAVRRVHVVFGPGHLNGPTMGDGPQPVVAVVAV